MKVLAETLLAQRDSVIAALEADLLRERQELGRARIAIDDLRARNRALVRAAQMRGGL